MSETEPLLKGGVKKAIEHSNLGWVWSLPPNHPNWHLSGQHWSWRSLSWKILFRKFFWNPKDISANVFFWPLFFICLHLPFTILHTSTVIMDFLGNLSTCAQILFPLFLFFNGIRLNYFAIDAWSDNISYMPFYLINEVNICNLFKI